MSSKDTEGTPGYDAWKAIPLERWYQEVAEANPHRCQHPGELCGERFLCDREEHRKGAYPTVELLASKRLLFHCENLDASPGDPGYRERLAGLVRREDVA